MLVKLIIPVLKILCKIPYVSTLLFVEKRLFTTLKVIMFISFHMMSGNHGLLIVYIRMLLLTYITELCIIY